MGLGKIQPGCNCCVSYTPVSCSSCPSDGPGAFQATMTALELWKHTHLNPAAEITLLDSIAGGAYLCDRTFTYDHDGINSYCMWLGPFMPMCFRNGGGSGDDSDYWAAVVLIGDLGGSDTATVMWQDFTQAEKDFIDALADGDTIDGTTGWSAHSLGSPVVGWQGGAVDYDDCKTINLSEAGAETNWIEDELCGADVCGRAGGEYVKIKNVAGTYALLAL